MQKYQIIPRRFRPRSFAEVCGHLPILTTLKNALAQKRIGQAYLFCGMRGCGKTTLARLFAKALNCQSLTPDAEACNTCKNCQEILEGSFLDIIEIDAASNRGIEDIRSLNETVQYAPHKGEYKIYIIDEVHMLTKEAFNALLKTLEEPPENVKFFFATTEPHKIPQTILSRCQRFNLSRIPEKQLLKKLTRICKELHVEAELPALELICRLSEGSLRDAESLLDQLICFGKMPITLDLANEAFGLLPDTFLKEIDSAIQDQNMEKALELGEKIYLSGVDIGASVEGLIEHFRDHLTHAMEKKRETPYTKSQCLLFLDTLLDWQIYMTKTPFKKVHMEMLIASLVRKAKGIRLEDLIERLLQLEGQVEPLHNPSSKSSRPTKIEPSQKITPSPELSENVKAKEKMDLAKLETIVQFAAVELEGSVIQKE